MSNQQRVTKEYINRIREIWNSQLSDFNKAVAHNAFAVPSLTSTVGILDWTCKEKLLPIVVAALGVVPKSLEMHIH